MRASTWTPLAIFYLMLAVVGGAATWTFNVIAGMEGSAFIGDYFGSGPAVTSIVIDVLVAATVGAVFIIVEGRRQGMRRLWVYILCFGVAFAFALPLFLAMREGHLAAGRRKPTTEYPVDPAVRSFARVIGFYPSPFTEPQHAPPRNANANVEETGPVAPATAQRSNHSI